MFFSNLVMYFIILLPPHLHAHGILKLRLPLKLPSSHAVAGNGLTAFTLG